MPPNRSHDLLTTFCGNDISALASFDEVSVYGEGTPIQKVWLKDIPDLVERAHQVFGAELPHVEFHFYSEYKNFRAGYIELTGHARFRLSEMSATGFYRNGRGFALVSERNKRGWKNPFGVVSPANHFEMLQSSADSDQNPMFLLIRSCSPIISVQRRKGALPPSN